jgi:beta-lactamase class A
MVKERIFALMLAAATFGCGTAGGVSDKAAEQSPEHEQAEQVTGTDPILRHKIGDIAEEAKGRVGVYAVMLESGESVGWNENERFAMQSVVKVPISLAVLRKVQESGRRRSDG